MKHRNLPVFSQAISDVWSGKYDNLTIALHWLVAVLIVTLFGLAQIWELLSHGPSRELLQALHVSLGCLLTLTMILRITWRLTGAKRLPHPGFAGRVAILGHRVLYVLVIVMMVTGPLKRWISGNPLDFFWYVSIPSPIAAKPEWHGTIGLIHEWGAWIIVTIASIHGSLALFHHYGLKDGVLLRMMPGRRRHV